SGGFGSGLASERIVERRRVAFHRSRPGSGYGICKIPRGLGLSVETVRTLRNWALEASDHQRRIRASPRALGRDATRARARAAGDRNYVSTSGSRAKREKNKFTRLDS